MRRAYGKTLNADQVDFLSIQYIYYHDKLPLIIISASKCYETSDIA